MSSGRTTPVFKRWILTGLLGFLAATGFARMPVGSNFWNIGWHQWNDIFSNGWNNVIGDNPWNPQFLEDISHYTVLRFMDWDEVNNSMRFQFSDRKLKSAASQNPVAYEWMIDLCNRNGSDMWICLPHRVELDYSLQLARLIRYGSSASGVPYASAQTDPVNPPLSGDLNVYVEFSNETWNSGFEQNGYCITMGTALNLPGQNQWYQGWAYHIYRAVQHFENFNAVFGTNSARVVKVLAGQAANPAIARHHLACLASAVCNPNGVTVDAYAIAPYLGNGINGSDTNAIDQLRDDITNQIQRCSDHSDLLDGTGIDLIAYEGGQHVVDQAIAVNLNPEIYPVYQEYLNGIDEYFDGVFAHYAHVGYFLTGGCWGSMQVTGQAIADAPKYRALRDYARGLMDTDGDELPDSWETQYFGGITNATATDTASNGINSVYQTYVAGINPTNAADRFVLSGFPGRLEWNAVSGRVYTVQWSTNLLSGFQTLETNIVWPQASITGSPAAAQGFYKIQVKLDH